MSRDKKSGEYQLTRMVPPGTLQYAFVCEYEVEMSHNDDDEHRDDEEGSATQLVQYQTIAREQPCILLHPALEYSQQQQQKQRQQQQQKQQRKANSEQAAVS